MASVKKTTLKLYQSIGDEIEIKKKLRQNQNIAKRLGIKIEFLPI